ncbi:MAG TPA: DUF4058 family protein [Gemmataceae bacterium]|nr:DUF4058 family protein [Gemmataceae bacterium]
MPLRDYFQPPVSNVASWEEVHGGWPMVIVQHLFPILPAGYVAAPRVHRGSQIEIDVATYEKNSESEASPTSSRASGNGGVATAVWEPPPTLEIETDLPEQDEYEVRIYDEAHARELVAAIELVSPANKDRAENRRAFVAKCAALLQKNVSVSIIDLITTRHFNLYTDLLELIGRTDPAMSPAPPPIYAVTCRSRKLQGRPRVAAWAYPLAVGQPLPPLPIWLTEETRVRLDLEASYEDTCRVLHIR